MTNIEDCDPMELNELHKKRLDNRGFVEDWELWTNFYLKLPGQQLIIAFTFGKLGLGEIGFSVKEVAELIHAKPETIRKQLKLIKEKIKNTCF